MEKKGKEVPVVEPALPAPIEDTNDDAPTAAATADAAPTSTPDGENPQAAERAEEKPDTPALPVGRRSGRKKSARISEIKAADV